jgi:hypothetical protein
MAVKTSLETQAAGGLLQISLLFLSSVRIFMSGQPPWSMVGDEK